MDGLIDQGHEQLMVLEEEFFLLCELGAWIGVWYGLESPSVDVAPMTSSGHEFWVVSIAVNLYKGGNFSSFSFIGD